MEYGRDAPQELAIKEVFIRFPLALGLLDEHGRILFANNSFASFCGTSQEAVRGRKIGEALPMPSLQTLLAVGHGQQRTRQGEFPLTPTSGGGVSMVKVTLTPLLLDRGPAFLLLLEDISEKVRWEEQLLQAEKLSGMAELAATVAHELGNPLGIISSTLQYMQTYLHDNQFHEEITVIIDQVERMHELLRTLMDVTGPAEPCLTRERVDRIFAQVLTFIAKEAEKHRVRIQTDFAPELPPCLVDSRQLKQVFLNLCKNALEATPEGGTLIVAIHPSAGKEKVAIKVKDTGVGIPPENLERIWKPFYSTKAGGRGLGLSLCWRVVQQHGGRIHVHSKYGEGTMFHIELPAAQEQT
ncbi:MAG: PAS domain S-box protein [Deltaproteobacteria bacterium]|nr:PAS domain S-box protein [Deltaproteobacteria bacterium]